MFKWGHVSISIQEINQAARFLVPLDHFLGWNPFSGVVVIDFFPVWGLMLWNQTLGKVRYPSGVAHHVVGSQLLHQLDAGLVNKL
jgi:hypothetical protein